MQTGFRGGRCRRDGSPAEIQRSRHGWRHRLGEAISDCDLIGFAGEKVVEGNLLHGLLKLALASGWAPY